MGETPSSAFSGGTAPAGTELERIRRALMTLSAVNRTLIRATDEVGLLRDICRAIVEKAGYRLAWVASAEHDEHHTIRPLAHWGFEEGFLDRFSLTWADNERGQHRLGVALRAGRICVVHDISTDPLFPPDRREEARKRGFASVVMLPLRVDERLFGALLIYAPEPDAFDERELALLAETAEDLAYGIAVLRMRAQREQTQHELERINRAHKTLSTANRALVRATDEQALLHEICRVIVEHGGYLYAWVAYARHDEDKRVQPMACAGSIDASYLEGLGLSWGEAGQGRSGPSVKAIRTGEPVIGRSFRTDPDLQFIREEALSRGYAAASAFPLRVGGEVIGSLAIGAGEPDAFDAAETELLSELAEDLAFGIATLRTHARSQQAEQTIQRMAYYDRFTGLPNRVRLGIRLEEALVAAKQRNQPLALLMLGLDHFQEINETLGYHQGDLLLQELATRVLRVIGDAESVARCGEAEFAILLPDCDAGAATRTAHKIQAALYEPVQAAGLMLDARASIGIALFPGHGSEPEVLIRRANVAMHRARKSGTGYAVYTGGLDLEYSRRLALMGDLHRAIDENELQLYCQPKVRLADRRICGAEALVRWQHPQRGLVSPAQFIMLAERSGLINPLTDWVMHAAFRQSYAWHQQGLSVPLAVNLSARDLQDPKLIERIRGLFDTWGADADWVQFELTESALMEDPRGALESLNRLKDLGSELFIDDFGTGYSSLSYLQKLPVDAIKIDKSFVEDMLTSRDSASIVRSTIDLAHDLDLEVVAEGVENEAFWDHLAAEGCDMAQGYVISKPIPTEEFRDWQAQSQWSM